MLWVSLSNRLGKETQLKSPEAVRSTAHPKLYAQIPASLRALAKSRTLQIQSYRTKIFTELSASDMGLPKAGSCPSALSPNHKLASSFT